MNADRTGSIKWVRYVWQCRADELGMDDELFRRDMVMCNGYYWREIFNDCVDVLMHGGKHPDGFASKTARLNRIVSMERQSQSVADGYALVLKLYMHCDSLLWTIYKIDRDKDRLKKLWRPVVKAAYKHMHRKYARQLVPLDKKRRKIKERDTRDMPLSELKRAVRYRWLGGIWSVEDSNKKRKRAFRASHSR